MNHILTVNWKLYGKRYVIRTIACPKPLGKLAMGERFTALYKGEYHHLTVVRLELTHELTVYVEPTL